MMQDNYYYNKYQHGFYPSPSLHRSQEQHQQQQQQHQRHVIILDEENEEKSQSHSELLFKI
jgi:hypothetical protein